MLAVVDQVVEKHRGAPVLCKQCGGDLVQDKNKKLLCGTCGLPVEKDFILKNTTLSKTREEVLEAECGKLRVQLQLAADSNKSLAKKLREAETKIASLERKRSKQE